MRFSSKGQSNRIEAIVMKTISIDKRTYDVIHHVLQEAGLGSEMEALKELALLSALAKIEKYEAESNFFKKKYNTSFEEFERGLNGQINQENFEMEDDYLDWKFAVEALIIWKKRKAALEEV